MQLSPVLALKRNPKIQNKIKVNIFRNLQKQNKSLIKKIKVITNHWNMSYKEDPFHIKLLQALTRPQDIS